MSVPAQPGRVQPAGPGVQPGAPAAQAPEPTASFLVYFDPTKFVVVS